MRVDEGTNVSDAYEQGDNRFTGRIHKVTVDVKEPVRSERRAAEGDGRAHTCDAIVWS